MKEFDPLFDLLGQGTILDEHAVVQLIPYNRRCTVQDKQHTDMNTSNRPRHAQVAMSLPPIARTLLLDALLEQSRLAHQNECTEETVERLSNLSHACSGTSGSRRNASSSTPAGNLSQLSYSECRAPWYDLLVALACYIDIPPHIQSLSDPDELVHVPRHYHRAFFIPTTKVT